MTDEERVLRAVRCECPEDPVVRLDGYEGTFQADLASGRSRLVILPRAIDPTTEQYCRHGFEIIKMHDGSMPPMEIVGVALFDDGEAYHLNDKAQFVRFYRRAAAAFEPLDLAQILLLYHAFRSFIAWDVGVSDKLELERPVSEIPGFSPPRVEGDKLEFWSYLPGPVDSTWEWVELHRWRVTGLGGDLDWEQSYEGSIRVRG